MLQIGSYVKVWEITKTNAKSVNCRISASEKGEDGSYKEVFGGYVTLYGTEIKEGEVYKVVNLSLTSSYDKESKKSYQNVFLKVVDRSATATKEEPLALDDLPFYK